MKYKNPGYNRILAGEGYYWETDNISRRFAIAEKNANINWR